MKIEYTLFYISSYIFILLEQKMETKVTLNELTFVNVFNRFDDDDDLFERFLNFFEI